MKSAGRSSISQIQDRIINELSGLDDGLEKYEYLIRLGRDLSEPDDRIRTDENAVSGCQARLWIRSEMQEGRLRLVADSDAMIIKGIIALLLRVLDDQPPQEILDADLYFLDRTGLRTHLSPSRANGLVSMVGNVPADRPPSHIADAEQAVALFFRELPRHSGLSERQILFVVDGFRQALYSQPGLKRARAFSEGFAQVAISDAVGDVRRALRLIEGRGRKSDERSED